MHPVLAELARRPTVFVRQHRDGTEHFASRERRNVYDVLHATGTQPWLRAIELPRPAGLATALLRAARPFVVELRAFSGEPLLRVVSEHTGALGTACAFYDGHGVLLARCTTRMQLLGGRRIDVADAKGAYALSVTSDKNSPWTFALRLSWGPSAGVLRKRFSGLLTELLTDADDYELRFEPACPPLLRLLLIGVTLAVDYAWFEEQGR